MAFKKFRTVLAAGVVIRIVIAPFFAHPLDVYSWYIDGQNVANGVQPLWDYLVPYGYALFLFAFPATIVFQALSGVLGSHVTLMSSLNPALNPGAPWNITVVPGPLFDLLVKLPLIASDAIIALLLYKIVMRYNNDDRLAVSAASLWFLNPLAIWVSSGWGMFDTLPAFFTVLAFYLLMQQRFAYSGVSLALAVAMKYYAIVLVLPLVILAWRERRWNGLLRSSIGAAGAGFLLFSPLFAEISSSFTSLAGGASPTELHYSGLSIWTAVTLFYPSFNQTILSSSLVAIALVATYYWTAKNASSSYHLWVVFFGLPLLVLLLFFRFVGENYFIWLLPFASIITAMESRLKLLYWGVSLVALLSSLVNSLLPYYMLPMAPWMGGYLASALSAVAPYRVAPSGVVVQGWTLGKAALAGLGVVIAVLLGATALQWLSPSGVLARLHLQRGFRFLLYAFR